MSRKVTTQAARFTQNILWEQKQLAWKIICSSLSEICQTTSYFMLAIMNLRKYYEYIIDHATSLKNDQHEVSISNITLGADNTKLNDKGV